MITRILIVSFLILSFQAFASDGVFYYPTLSEKKVFLKIEADFEDSVEVAIRDSEGQGYSALKNFKNGKVTLELGDSESLRTILKDITITNIGKYKDGSSPKVKFTFFQVFTEQDLSYLKKFQYSGSKIINIKVIETDGIKNIEGTMLYSFRII